MALDAIQHDVDALRERERVAVALAEERRVQIVRLEEDIAALYANATAVAGGTAGGAAGAAGSGPGSATAAPSSPLTALEGGAVVSGAFAAPGTEGRPGALDNTSLVAILTNQRDRYRRRGQELEEVFGRAASVVGAAKGERWALWLGGC